MYICTFMQCKVLCQEHYKKIQLVRMLIKICIFKWSTRTVHCPHCDSCLPENQSLHVNTTQTTLFGFLSWAGARITVKSCSFPQMPVCGLKQNPNQTSQERGREERNHKIIMILQLWPWSNFPSTSWGDSHESG